MSDSLVSGSASRAGSRPLSRWGALSFSTGALPLGAFTVAIAVYLPAYFASRLGVKLAVIGAAWATVRLLDIGVDPLLGIAMDRTRTPLGRYRVWLAASAPVLMAAGYMLFMAAPGIGTVYLVGWLLVLYLGLSMLTLSHQAWAASLSRSYDGRSRLFGALAMMGVIGAAAILVVPVAAKALRLGAVQIVQDMGWLIIASVPVAIAIVIARTPETLRAKASGAHFRLRDYGAVLAKPDLIRLYLASMAVTLGPGWMSALYVFFFTAARHFTAMQASALLLVYILAGVVGAPVTARLAIRFGKHRTLIANTTAYSIGLVVLVLMPKGNVALALPFMAWCGAMAAGFGLMINAMIADVADEVRLDQGKDQLSLLYALNTLSVKIAGALAIGFSYPLLGRLGYNAAKGAANTPAAIHSLELVYIVGPVVFVMLGGVCVMGWRLDAKRHAVIRAALDAREAEPAEAAPTLDSLAGRAGAAGGPGAPERQTPEPRITVAESRSA